MNHFDESLMQIQFTLKQMFTQKWKFAENVLILRPSNM